GPLPVEGRGGLFATFSCTNEHTQIARGFSLSPQRGEGRGEGCEQTKALALSKAFRHSLPDESDHPCPLVEPKHARTFSHAFRILLLFALLAGSACNAEVKTPKKRVSNDYHGIKVQDEYQWLENGNDPNVRKWSAAQNQQARAFLDRAPGRGFFEARLQQLFAKSSADYFGMT